MRSGLAGLVGWTPNSFIDYPGTVATVLFFSGCNLRCPYCHNPSVVRAAGERSGVVEKVMRFLRERRGLVDGVVLSGGEPTLHATMAHLADKIRELGYRVKLDTNGLLPRRIEEIAPDYLALDLKGDPAAYGALLGAEIRDVDARMRRSLDLVRELGGDAEVRITVAPAVITRDVIFRLRDLLHGVARVYLQQVELRGDVLDPSYAATHSPMPAEEIMEYRELLAPVVGECAVRNL